MKQLSISKRQSRRIEVLREDEKILGFTNQENIQPENSVTNAKKINFTTSEEEPKKRTQVLPSTKVF